MKRPWSEALAWGQELEERYARALARRGAIVAPLCRMLDVIADTPAPMLFGPDGPLTAPDLLVMQDGRIELREVKAKERPTFRQYSPGPRWEHGVDYAHFRDYRDAARRAGVGAYIIVYEDASPDDPGTDSALNGPPLWLGISLEDAHQLGDRRRDWPGGKREPFRRGAEGLGGWLWPRWAMTGPNGPLALRRTPTSRVPSPGRTGWLFGGKP